MATALDLDLLQTPFAPSPGVTQPGASARSPSPTLQGSGNYNYTRESGTDGSNAMPASTGWLGSADMYHNTQGALQVCWQQQFNQEWALLSSQAPVPLAGISTNPVNDVVRSNSKSPCLLTTMRQLSELNVELFAHETTVPKPPVSLSEPLSWKDKDFAIDRTFQLSQRLIEALNKQYPRYLETASVDVSKDSSSDVTQSSTAPVDQGFFLLILSCYTRLIEIYDRIFANMQACLDRSSVTDREDYVNLPSVKVGSFSLPDSSATQILLILQLSRHLLTRMSEVIEAIGVDKPNNKQDLTASECATGPGTLLVKSALTTVKLQEDGLMKRITQLRSTLLELNIL
ncbi:hypothetical protein UA08_04978 [Talaromyces atroroseus]|uniref:Aflatoxin regulatory protein domain-containing protein n=1 Tax=Talaromyces atroroseus TaxID=1441469 RepID=A0A225B1X4_TALAT|nr:hypothetical protein UA08_04978 [Talaromyces atroroseus]OKL59817.1 hypothetical protein UA08_04978 [Talaromyces atroroseus]